MINKNFYPTPETIAFDMVQVVKDYAKNKGKDYRKLSILEPSAGKGDLIKAITGFSRNRVKPKVYACEVEPQLQTILFANKDCQVIGNDFLQLHADQNFDAIIMNPPFDNGMSHFLKAWGILRNGILVCLLNSSNLQQDTRKANLINSIIEDNGGYKKELGKCFQFAERKTNVEVVMLVVEKVTECDFSCPDIKGQTESFEFKNLEESNELEVSDLLKQYENRYKATVEQFKAASIEVNRLFDLMNPFVSSSSYKSEYIGQAEQNIFESLYNKNINKFLEYFRGKAWSTLLASTNFESKLTSAVKDSFINKFEQQKNFAYTKSNMLQLMEVLLVNSKSILEQCVLQVFDDLTKYHKENRIHIEGWKSNDAYKVKQKFIIPNMWEMDFYKLNYDRQDLLNDIDKCLCRLVGIKYNTEPKDKNGKDQPFIVSIVDAVKKDEKEGTRDFESTFFKIKTFKKGTAHFTFKDESVWRIFNKKASELRGFPIGAAGAESYSKSVTVQQ